MTTVAFYVAPGVITTVAEQHWFVLDALPELIQLIAQSAPRYG